MTIEVWYQLVGEEEPDKVKVEDGADVVDLKDAIKTKWGDDLACAAPRLKVFPAGADDPNINRTPLGPGETVPGDTTDQNPLIVVAPQQQLDEDPARKRRKFLSPADIESLPNEEALRTLQGVSKDCSTVAADPKNFCYPRKLPSTWNESLLADTLRKKRDKLLKFIQEGEERTPRVLAIRLGTGCGKTHVLLEAPRLLGATGLYITYNGDQALGADKDVSKARHSILLRVLLRSFGVSNNGCAAFLNSEDGKPFLECRLDRLQSLVLDRLKTFCGGGNLAICIDETRELLTSEGNAAARSMISEMGIIASRLYGERNVICTVLASTLKFDTFKTVSYRWFVEYVELPPIDFSAVQFVIDSILAPAHRSEAETIVGAVAGLHFRSIVFAADELRVRGVPTVPHLMKDLSDRLVGFLDPNTRTEIRKYVCESISIGRDAKDGKVQEFVDSKRSIAPPLIWQAFSHDGNRDDIDIPAQEIFNASGLVTSPKQHELCGYEYDRLRASKALPVVPKYVQVGGTRTREWYDKLRFPGHLKKSDVAIFENLRIQGKVQVVRTSHSLHGGLYYLPQTSGHPWIDRACICFHKDTSEQCLLLYHNKVNASLPEALESLRKDAMTLLSESNTPERVLCIANVVGASDKTTSQNKFEYPYIVVRDSEIEAFYSVNFAPAIRFVRSRHSKGG